VRGIAVEPAMGAEVTVGAFIVVGVVDGCGAWTGAIGRGVVPPSGPVIGPEVEIVESVSRLNARSRADWKRCSRSFSRQRRTSRSTAGGTPGLNCVTSGGSSFRIALSVSMPELRLKARWPLRIS
jgi:hypothetical protein